MPKIFKEKARILKLPAINRGYLFANGIQIENLSNFFSK